MKTSEQLNELGAALAKAQGEIEDAKKDQQAHQYKYADLAQVLQIARPVLSKYGLSVIQAASNAEADVSVTTRLLHSSGQWIEETLTMPAIVSKAMSPAQVVGSLITYGRRYSLAAMVGITQEDNDAAGEKAKEGDRVAVVPRRTSVRQTVLDESGGAPNVSAYLQPVAEAIDGEDVAGLTQLRGELLEMGDNAWISLYDKLSPAKRGKADYLLGGKGHNRPAA